MKKIVYVIVLFLMFFTVQFLVVNTVSIYVNGIENPFDLNDKYIHFSLDEKVDASSLYEELYSIPSDKGIISFDTKKNYLYLLEENMIHINPIVGVALQPFDTYRETKNALIRKSDDGSNPITQLDVEDITYDVIGTFDDTSFFTGEVGTDVIESSEWDAFDAILNLSATSSLKQENYIALSNFDAYHEALRIVGEYGVEKIQTIDITSSFLFHSLFKSTNITLSIQKLSVILGVLIVMMYQFIHLSRNKSEFILLQKMGVRKSKILQKECISTTIQVVGAMASSFIVYYLLCKPHLLVHNTFTLEIIVACLLMLLIISSRCIMVWILLASKRNN